MADDFDCLRSALADRYSIEREIGSGGMALVYLAEDLKHKRKGMLLPRASLSHSTLRKLVQRTATGNRANVCGIVIDRWCFAVPLSIARVDYRTDYRTIPAMSGDNAVLMSPFARRSYSGSTGKGQLVCEFHVQWSN